MIVDARFRMKFWIVKGTGGNEKLANGVLCILDGWVRNPPIGKLVSLQQNGPHFCSDFRSSDGENWHLVFNKHVNKWHTPINVNRFSRGT